MVLGAVGLGVSVLGGYLGNREQDAAAREQRAYIDAALDKLGFGLDSIRDSTRRGRVHMDELLGVSRSLEGDLLGQIDPQVAAGVRRIRQQRERTEAEVSQRLSRRGMDSFTTRIGAQATARGAADNATNDLVARTSGMRTNAINQGRSALMGALGSYAGFEQQAGSLEANQYNRMAGLLGGVQVQAGNVGAGIGQIGGSLLSMYRTSVLEQALKNSGPGGGGF